MTASSTDGLLAEAVQMKAEMNVSEYERLVSLASKLVADGGNLAKAIKQAKKACELLPHFPTAYHVLGSAHEANGAPKLAAEAFISAMEKAEADQKVDPKIWADSAAHAYAMLIMAPDAAKPIWWTDDDLLRLSERAVILLPNDLRSQKWRADVLSGLQSALPASNRSDIEHRSPEQYRDAATHFQAVAALLPSADAKRGMVKAGVMCRARADALEKHLASLPVAPQDKAVAPPGPAPADAEHAAAEPLPVVAASPAQSEPASGSIVAQYYY